MSGVGCANLHSCYPPPDVHLPLNLDVVKGLFAELLLPQRPVAARHGARRGPVGEDAVDARLAHLVVALRVDQEAHVGVEVA